MISTKLTQAERLRSPDMWRSMAPDLHIGDAAALSSIDAIALTPEQARMTADLVRVEGYLQGNNTNPGVNFTRLAALVRGLVAADLSPVFAFLYDEFWVPFYKLHPLYVALLGENYSMLPDFWVWNVDSTRGEAGWLPHRDKGYLSLFPDGSPKSLTSWIPLSSATPLNSCMYLVPADRDPTYGTEKDNELKIDWPSIRALPVKPGDFLVWNQAVLHWGSRGSPHATETRVSMAFEFQRNDVDPFNLPLIKPLSILPFEARLKLIAKQILQYRHMYKVDPQVERMALDVLG